jgi:hypothetical protein
MQPIQITVTDYGDSLLNAANSNYGDSYRISRTSASRRAADDCWIHVGLRLPPSAAWPPFRSYRPEIVGPPARAYARPCPGGDSEPSVP